MPTLSGDIVSHLFVTVGKYKSDEFAIE